MVLLMAIAIIIAIAWRAMPHGMVDELVSIVHYDGDEGALLTA